MAKQEPLAIATSRLQPLAGDPGRVGGRLKEESSILAETLLGGDETARGADTVEAKSTIAPTGQKRTLVGFEDYKGRLKKRTSK